MTIHETYKIPQNDIEAWLQYPRLNWVYDTQRLLDAQHTPWTPFYGCSFDQSVPIHHFDQELLIEDAPYLGQGDLRTGHVFVEKPEFEKRRFTETVIVKGEIKMSMQTDDNVSITENFIGEAELRIYAFATMYLQKFTGCASFETYGNIIYAVRLCPTKSMLPHYERDIPKLLKRHLKRVA